MFAFLNISFISFNILLNRFLSSSIDSDDNKIESIIRNRILLSDENPERQTISCISSNSEKTKRNVMTLEEFKEKYSDSRNLVLNNEEPLLTLNAGVELGSEKMALNIKYSKTTFIIIGGVLIFATIASIINILKFFYFIF